MKRKRRQQVIKIDKSALNRMKGLSALAEEIKSLKERILDSSNDGMLVKLLDIITTEQLAILCVNYIRDMLLSEFIVYLVKDLKKYDLKERT